MDKANIVSLGIDINATPAEIWKIITQDKYAKELGSVFDKNAFIESNWKLGSKVHFKYEPDRLISTGIVGKWIENKLIQVDYDFPGMDYVEKYSLETKDSLTTLSVYAGTYGEDFEDQKNVWNNWLLKVKELCSK